MQRSSRCFAEPGPRFLRVASNRGPGSAAHRSAKSYALRCVRGMHDAMPMTDSRPRLKIIAIGFNTDGTGLTRVMQNIMRRLADRHEIHYLAIGYCGETIRD